MGERWAVAAIQPSAPVAQERQRSKSNGPRGRRVNMPKARITLTGITTGNGGEDLVCDLDGGNRWTRLLSSTSAHPRRGVKAGNLRRKRRPWGFATPVPPGGVEKVLRSSLSDKRS